MMDRLFKSKIEVVTVILCLVSFHAIGQGQGQGQGPDRLPVQSPILIQPSSDVEKLNGSTKELEDELPLEEVEVTGNEASLADEWESLDSAPIPIESLSHKDVISFNNGDFLAGQLHFWDVSNKTLKWHYPGSLTAFSVNAGHVSRLRFEPVVGGSRGENSNEKQSNSNIWQFFLTTGEIVDGTLSGLGSDGDLHIHSNLLGDLVVPREFVQSIYPDFSYAEALYRGPHSMTGWTKGNVRLEDGEGGQWRYNKQALYATEAASLARVVNLTPLSSIDLDVAWKGTLNFAIALYTDHLQPIRLADKENEPAFGPFYSLQIGSQSARLQAINKSDPIRQLGYAFIPTLNQKTQAKFTILTDSRSASVTLLVDDKRVHTWRDTQGFFAKGKAIRIVHQGLGSIRIGSLTVRKWNGIVDSSEEKAVQYRSDVVQLNNGKNLKGTIQNIVNRHLHILLSNGETKGVQMNEVHSIHFIGTGWKKPSARMVNTKMEFYTNEKLDAGLARMDGRGLYFEHSIFGKQMVVPPFNLKTLTPYVPVVK